MHRVALLLALVPFCTLGACVGDSPVTNPDTGADAPVGPDGSTDAGVDAPTDGTTEAGPPPCGAPGEACCTAPLAPCGDGLTCSTGTVKKCMVSEAWAVGTYTTVTAGPTFITQFVSAHYDGSTWTIQPPVNTFTGFGSSYDPKDIYELGTNVRVIATEANVGHMYSWNSVKWDICGLGQLCVGPTMNADVDAITSVTNSGANDYWIAGSNMMFRCASGASSCTSVTTGIPGTWGQGAFAGQTSSDLWYSQFDHVLHYDGNTWSSMSVADAYTIGDVATNDMWIGQKQLRHWDGQAWSNAYLVAGSQTPGTILSIAGSGSTDVHAVGNDQTQTGASFDAHWDGTGWKLATLPPIAHVQKVYAPSPIDAFVVGANPTIGPKGVIAHWDGTQWTEMPSPTVTYSGETQPGGLTWISVTGQARPRRK